MREYRQLVDARVEKIRAANPDADMDAVPVDLVTCSGSGLDPEISPDAAEYQVPRLAKATGKSEDEVRDIIAACTKGPFPRRVRRAHGQRAQGEPYAGRRAVGEGVADEGMTDYLSPPSTPPISCGEIRTVLAVKSLIYSVFHRNFFEGRD